MEEDIEKLELNIDAGEDLAQELADIAATEKSDAARRRLRAVEEELAGYESKLQDLRSRRDAMSSATVMRRLDAIQGAVTNEPLSVFEANKALKQAVSKIVMDAEGATLSVHWHHADEPSEPIYFVSKHNRWDDQPDLTPEE